MIYPEKIVVPKEYNESTLKHDLIVIVLSEPAKLSNFVAPVCLPRDDLLKDDLLEKTVEVVSEGNLREVEGKFKIFCFRLDGGELRVLNLIFEL